MRKLATIQKIRNIRPIDGADMIELATINNWDVVVGKNVGHSVGDWVVYCEVDSFLPIRPEYEFLRKTSFKKMLDLEGFRLRTIKMRGTRSQGLILPLSVFEGYNYGPSDTLINGNPALILNQVATSINDMIEIIEGTDVTELLGILKYEAPIPPELEGMQKGGFPGFISKTDEERIQNLTSKYEDYKKLDTKWYVTEKLEGTSSTFFTESGTFGYCGRNTEYERQDDFVPTEILCSDGKLRMTKENTFWKVLRELKIEERISDFEEYEIAIQGEMIGEGVQGNIYRIKGHSVRFFNVFDITNQRKVPLEEFEKIMKYMELQTVPILDRDFTLPDTIDELLEYADAKSELNKERWREGIVIRSHDNKISFKVISNKYLIKQK